MQIFGSLKLKTMAGDKMFVSEVHHWKTVKSHHFMPRTKVDNDKNKVKVK
jgi:hypothetical protein